MAPQNIGIKAIELYFPSRVSQACYWNTLVIYLAESDTDSMWLNLIWRRSSVPALANIPLDWARQTWVSVTTAKVSNIQRACPNL